MKSLPWLGLACGLLVWTCTVQSGRIQAEALAEKVHQQFCPDKRVCIWDVSFSGGKPLVLSGSTNLPDAKAQLVHQLREAGIPFIDSLQVFPAAELEGKCFGLVNVSVCNIRSEPRHSAELATQAIMGTPLRIFEQQGDWYRVQTPDQYIGWLDTGGLITLDSLAFNHWRRSGRVIVSDEFCTAKSSPDPGSFPVSDLVSGCILEKSGEEGGFIQVSFPDGRTGYLAKEHTRPFGEWENDRIPGWQQLFHSATALLGRPYLWGGTSVKAMDCSGFTKTVFFENGLILPRDASQQVRVGEDVQKDSIQKGDLLFFGRKGSTDVREKITHVAIYLGEGTFIHCSGQVKIESLDPESPLYSEYRDTTFVRAKRLLTPSLDHNMLVRNHPLY